VWCGQGKTIEVCKYLTCPTEVNVITILLSKVNLSAGKTNSMGSGTSFYRTNSLSTKATTAIAKCLMSNRTKMSQERINKLESIGFDWSVRATNKWDENYVSICIVCI
jgi:hypothetical protein